MPDTLTAPDETPPAGLPLADAEEWPPDGHTPKQARSCGYCQSRVDLLNEAARRG